MKNNAKERKLADRFFLVKIVMALTFSYAKRKESYLLYIFAVCKVPENAI